MTRDGCGPGSRSLLLSYGFWQNPNMADARIVILERPCRIGSTAGGECRPVDGARDLTESKWVVGGLAAPADRDRAPYL